MRVSIQLISYDLNGIQWPQLIEREKLSLLTPVQVRNMETQEWL